MDEVTVRWFRPEDADAVAALQAESNEWFEETELSKEFITECSQRPDFRFMVAEYQGQVVGFAGTLFFPAVGRAELGPIGIKQALQNHGIGGELIHGILAFLRTLGVHRTIAHVKASNLNAIKFFLNNNFVFEAYLREYTRKREDVIQLLYLEK